MSGLGYRGGGQPPPHGHLVPGGGDGVDRVVTQAQRGRGGGGDGQALIIDGQHGVEPGPPVERSDGGHGEIDVGQGYDHGPVAHRGGHGLAPLGAHEHVHPELAGRSQEVSRSVGLGRQ